MSITINNKLNNNSILIQLSIKNQRLLHYFRNFEMKKNRNKKKNQITIIIIN